MDYYDEFYNEPDGFNDQIESLRLSLYACVKQDILDKIERLEKENAALQAVKDNWEKLNQEFDEKKRDLEAKRRNLRYEVRKERLSELMKDFQIVMYRASSEGKQKQKCDKCDKDRRIHFQSPTGKDCYESCECASYEYKFVPSEFICTEFKIDNRNQDQIVAWYKEHKEDDYYERTATYRDAIYEKGMPYEKLEKYKTFFKDRDECQKYCDWLNEQKGQ